MGEFSISTLIYLSLEKLATDEIHFNPLFSDGKIVRDAIWNMGESHTKMERRRY